MQFDQLKRWGVLLDVLAELSDIEHQVVLQVHQPGRFVPDDLLERWDEAFQGGLRIRQLGLSDALLATLIEFDYQLDSLIDIVPGDPPDKESYIRNDEIWQVVCELAEYTISQVMLQMIPMTPTFSQN